MPAHPIGPVPEDTQRVTRAAFPRGTIWTLLRDRLSAIYDEDECVRGSAQDGRPPARVPWRLALVSIMQFAEGLSDRQAADAVRARLDWKYALSLPLDDPGFDADVLPEFRARLLSGLADHEVGSALLAICRKQGWLPEPGALGAHLQAYGGFDPFPTRGKRTPRSTACSPFGSRGAATGSAISIFRAKR